MGEYSLQFNEGYGLCGKPYKLTLYILAGLGIVVAIIGISLIIAGAVKSNQDCPAKSTSTPHVQPTDQCKYSTEAKRVGLDKLLAEVKSTYFKVNPNNIVYDPESTPTDIRQVFSPYNCHPNAIKYRTDTAKKLYEKTNLIERQVDKGKLQPREVKSVAQLKHFLQSNFGAPYDENYYAGDWMLGPNLFCWHPICSVGNDIAVHFNYRSFGFKPKTVDDIDFVIDHLKQLNDSLMQYIENLKYGVQAGYVRSVEECEAGLFSFQRKFLKVTQLGETGILNSTTTRGMRDQRWFAGISTNTRDAWKQKSGGKTVEASIDESLVNLVGRPLDKLLSYLSFNHSQFCVPSNISSGLATLPLDYIYKNGTNTGVKTTKVLPNGEKLSGKEAYKSILPYFTTTTMSPEEIYSLGEEMLGKLYPEAVKIAREITGVQDEAQAVAKFKKKLESQEMFFNDDPIPANESNKEAFMKCLNMESAKVYCPSRYQAMLKWFDYVNNVLSLLYPKTTNMFYYTGKKRSTPNCPVMLVANFNPATGSQSYQRSNSICSRPCRYRLPFYLKDLGPRYNAYSVAAHEARPGHHTQVQSFVELFGDKCSGVIGWLNGVSYYTAFSEGWALYAENPLINTETDTYKNLPLQKYGMLKWQIWRALRLMMDTGLHYKGMTRQEALDLFAKYAWDRTDKAVKDVTRYQSDPGQATAYMIGQLAIWRYRNATIQRLKAGNKDFNEKEFHYQVLSQGASPLSYLEGHLQKFAECVINPRQTGCDSILNPPSSSGRSTVENDDLDDRDMTITALYEENEEEEEFVDLDVAWEGLSEKPRNPRFNPEHYD